MYYNEKVGLHPYSTSGHASTQIVFSQTICCTQRESHLPLAKHPKALLLDDLQRDELI